MGDCAVLLLNSVTVKVLVADVALTAVDGVAVAGLVAEQVMDFIAARV